MTHEEDPISCASCQLAPEKQYHQCFCHNPNCWVSDSPYVLDTKRWNDVHDGILEMRKKDYEEGQRSMTQPEVATFDDYMGWTQFKNTNPLPKKPEGGA